MAAEAPAAVAVPADEWSYSFGTHDRPDGQGERALLQAAEKLGHVLVRRDQGIAAQGVHFVLRRSPVDRSDAFLAYAAQLVMRVALLHAPRPTLRIIVVTFNQTRIIVLARYNADPDGYAVWGINIDWTDHGGQELWLSCGETSLNTVDVFSAKTYKFVWSLRERDEDIRTAALNTLDDMIGRAERRARTPSRCVVARGNEGPHAIACTRRPRLPPLDQVVVDFQDSADWRSAIYSFYALLYELDAHASHADVWRHVFGRADAGVIASITLACNNDARVPPCTAIVRRGSEEPEIRVPYEPQSFRHTGWLRKLLRGRLLKTPERLAREAAERKSVAGAEWGMPVHPTRLLPAGVDDIVARFAGVCLDTPVARDTGGCLLPSGPARERAARIAADLQRMEMDKERRQREEAMQAARAARDAKERPRRE